MRNTFLKISLATFWLAASGFAERIVPEATYTIHMVNAETDLNNEPVVPRDYPASAGLETIYARIGPALVTARPIAYYASKGIPGQHERTIHYQGPDGKFKSGPMQFVADAEHLVTTAKSWSDPMPSQSNGSSGCGILARSLVGYEVLGQQKLLALHEHTTAQDLVFDNWYWEDAGCVMVQHLSYRPSQTDHKSGQLFVRLDNGVADERLLDVPSTYEEANFTEAERRINAAQLGADWKSKVTDYNTGFFAQEDKYRKLWQDGHAEAVSQVKEMRSKAAAIARAKSPTQ